MQHRRSCLEAEAYAGYMNGNLALYREDWNMALQSFTTARRIYTELLKVGSLEQQDLLQQVLDEISFPFPPLSCLDAR